MGHRTVANLAKTMGTIHLIPFLSLPCAQPTKQWKATNRQQIQDEVPMGHKTVANLAKTMRTIHQAPEDQGKELVGHKTVANLAKMRATIHFVPCLDLH